jgi:uncharacterized protein (TIGR00369 family)
MSHFQKLERMYLSAPINRELYESVTIKIAQEHAELSLTIGPKYHHAANAMHGSVYFKLLDDSAFFAVNSIVDDVFVYTVSINIQLLRPVASGTVRAVGEVKFKSTNLFIADSELFDEKGKLVGRGSGNFMRSKIPLTEEIGYR